MFEIITVLLLMTFIFMLWLSLKRLFKKTLIGKLCVICATVSSTWILLIILKLLGYLINSLIVAILMGASVTGIMYFIERRYKKLLWTKPLIIFVGIAVVYLILRGVYG